MSSERGVKGLDMVDDGREEGGALSAVRVLCFPLGDVGEERPKSVMDDPLSLWRIRRANAFAALVSDSLYSVAESAVDIDVLGDPGRAKPLPSRYARSRSDRCFDTAYLFISVPFAVSVGLVIGAEITAAEFPRKPCETVFTVTGERDEGPSLW